MKTFLAIALVLSAGANVYQWQVNVDDDAALAESRVLAQRAIRVALGYRSDLVACRAIRVMPTVAL